MTGPGWGAQHTNPVLATRYRHLTTPEQNRLTAAQARVACAASLLRWLHSVVTRQVAWDPDIAAGRRGPRANRTPPATVGAAAA